MSKHISKLRLGQYLHLILIGHVLVKILKLKIRNKRRIQTVLGRQCLMKKGVDEHFEESFSAGFQQDHF